MKKLLIQFIFYLAWIVSTPAHAQSPQQIAIQVQRAYEKTQDMQMNFEQSTWVRLLETEVKKTGQAQFKKRGKFLIQYQGRRGKQYVCNGKKLWVYRQGDSQVQVYSCDEETVPAEALSFLGGLGNLKTDFVVAAVEPQKEIVLKRKSADLKWLQLTPQKKRSQIQWLVMGFDPESYLIEELYMFTDSGNLSHYHFTRRQVNQGIKDKVFEFKKKGVKAIRR